MSSFIIASLVLTVAGFASILMQGGLKYGIDFKGGALMKVKFAEPPHLDKLRAALNSRIKGENTVQNFTDISAKNEVELGTELQEERQLNTNRKAMEEVNPKHDQQGLQGMAEAGVRSHSVVDQGQQ